MTKAQNATFDILDEAVATMDIISWNYIVEKVKATGFIVKNWLSIRGVLQVYINEGQIKRTDDLYVEEYAVVGNG